MVENDNPNNNNLKNSSKLKTIIKNIPTSFPKKIKQLNKNTKNRNYYLSKLSHFVDGINIK